MNARRLTPRALEKVWGRRDIGAAFSALGTGPEPIGEIWFEAPGATHAPLLAKYLFTSERLSIQVHPDDEAARARGHRSGKDEAWLVLSADPGATIGLGLTRDATREELRDAALDGSIEQLLDWRPVRAGDIFYSPAGTVHAIGGGLSLIEVQQNVDLTYRLYDYGRPRELHLEDGIAVARPERFAGDAIRTPAGSGRRCLHEGGAFRLERWTGGGHTQVRGREDAPVLLVPITGGASAEGEELPAGSVWHCEGPVALAGDAGADLLIATPRSV